jgi:hypothetical protein
VVLRAGAQRNIIQNWMMAGWWFTAIQALVQKRTNALPEMVTGLDGKTRRQPHWQWDVGGDGDTVADPGAAPCFWVYQKFKLLKVRTQLDRVRRYPGTLGKTKSA